MILKLKRVICSKNVTHWISALPKHDTAITGLSNLVFTVQRSAVSPSCLFVTIVLLDLLSFIRIKWDMNEAMWTNGNGLLTLTVLGFKKCNLVSVVALLPFDVVHYITHFLNDFIPGNVGPVWQQSFFFKTEVLWNWWSIYVHGRQYISFWIL
jgi:hypothetical protein